MATLKYILCVLMLLALEKSVKAQSTTEAYYVTAKAAAFPQNVSTAAPKKAASTPSSTTSTTTSSYVTSSGAGGGGKSANCNTPSCPTCPDGYHEYHEYTSPCSYNCLCQLSKPTTVLPGKSNGLLLSILRNLQNNADALEQMAKGLSDETDLAQKVAALP